MSEEQKPPEPQPIVLTATLYPDGKLNINCPLMNDPMRMFGYLEVIKDAVKQIMDNNAKDSAPRIIPRRNFLDGLRGMK